MPDLTTHTRTELAHRSGDGVDVTLVWLQGDDEDRAVVCVCNWREGAYFEVPAEPYLALEVDRLAASFEGPRHGRLAAAAGLQELRVDQISRALRRARRAPSRSPGVRLAR